MVTLEIQDLTPRFLDFYTTATQEQAGEERRWQLWREKYGFAAVPPTPKGQALARTLLSEAWPAYPGVLERIRQGAAGMQPAPLPVLEEVARLLECQRPVHVRLIAFVGALEGNAFVAPQGDVTVACFPVEQDPEARRLVMPHEFTHVVHHLTAGFSLGWQRSVAEVIMQEGLAARVAQRLAPGHEPAAYIEYTPGWLPACEARQAEILQGLLPHLEESDSDTVYRFTVGTGTTGREREAYYAGWLAVGHLLAKGRFLAELAAVPARDLPRLVKETLQDVLSGQR